ncbi:MAG TPA: methyltransferase domain-containing protein [Gemmatimonadales bacterium]|nr:methyltransferase domain-containing protein [Gemmatimonadales bacterium]
MKSVAFAEDAESEVVSGVLQCRTPECTAWYPVLRGIPRMLPADLREALTDGFVREFRSRLEAAGVALAPAAPAEDPLGGLKRHTIRNFGFEWLEYARFGWDDPVHNTAYEEALFRRKALLEPGEIAGKLVLDAGCGNGRYTHWAAQYGARVIGVDLGDGVESAAANNRDRPNVQIVQGDIFRLPFAAGTFDAVFSIGVLMHTGNAKLATAALARLVRPGGTVTVHLYGKGNVIYEAVDWSLRQWTTRMSIERLQAVTRGFFRVRQALERARLDALANRFIRIGPHPHIIFDWYAAPIATHHTYPEVLAWFDEMRVPVVRTNAGPPGSLARRLLRPLLTAPGVVTVKGEVPA